MKVEPKEYVRKLTREEQNELAQLIDDFTGRCSEDKAPLLGKYLRIAGELANQRVDIGYHKVVLEYYTGVR